jgi:hypothetical protein
LKKNIYILKAEKITDFGCLYIKKTINISEMRGNLFSGGQKRLHEFFEEY